MKEYTLTVGLEIHAQLSTQTKMFCISANDPEESRPNTNTCPVCMGHPGTLPVINKEAVRSVLRLGAAIKGELADYTEFDRKNYFYPDIPKGYQISQYKYPLVRGGSVLGVPVTRIHLEEDTARSTHPESKEDRDYSLVDFNRAGAPLMELVTEPDIHEAKVASDFAKELQLILIYLGISNANMEKGEMRIEANVSVSRDATPGTKVEVKNLNSFKAVEKAINYEYHRQIEVLESGQKVVQETRGWDEKGEETFSQRAKEESHDYRYFPDPDLPKLFISEIADFSRALLEESLPELPQEKRQRLKKMGISDEHVEVYVSDVEKGQYFEKVAQELGDETLSPVASNYIVSDLKKLVDSSELAEVVRMIKEGSLSSRGAKDTLRILENSGGNARSIAESHGLLQKSNAEELRAVAASVIAEHPQVVEEYKGGKATSLQYLIGQAMKATKGSGNPQVLREIFEDVLD